MKCKKCGAECLPDTVFCMQCGTKITEEPETENLSVNEPEQQDTEALKETEAFHEEEAASFPNNEYPTAPIKRRRIGVLIVAVILAVVLALVGIIVAAGRYIGIKRLENELERDWSRVESEGSTYYTLELDFSDKTMDYCFDSYFDSLDTTIATYKYKVISPDTVEFTFQNGAKQEVKIEFDDDHTMMTMTPAITKIDTEEFWFNHD